MWKIVMISVVLAVHSQYVFPLTRVTSSRGIGPFDNSWILSSNCETCDGSKSKFNPSESTSFRNKTSGFDPNVNCRYYYGCFIQGTSAIDEVRLYEFDSHLQEDLEFILVSYTQNCENLPFDGVLGLACVGKWGLASIIDTLWKNSKIPEPVFSLFIHNSNNQNPRQSVIQIGEADLQSFSSNPEELFYVPGLPSSEEWIPKFEAVQLGPWSYNYSASIKMTSSHQNILGDSNFYFHMLPYLKQSGLDCLAMPKNFIQCQVTDKDFLPELIFWIGGKNIRLGGEDLWDCIEFTCTLKIEFSRAGYWMIGEALLENYFTIYNLKDLSVGFAPSISKKSKKGAFDSSKGTD